MKIYRVIVFLSIFINCGSIPMATGRVLGDANWGTHMAPLFVAVANTDGPILEMGCGDFSTPLLHALCAPNNRFLLTAESDEKWMKLFDDLKRDWHHFVHVQNISKWEDVGLGIHWSVVLIDHAPAKRRVVDIKRLRSYVDIFVVHDTERKYYDYEPTLSTFKYKYTYRRYKITTTLLSDTIDVARFFKN